MTSQKSVLFVCTANVFRSLSAQECFKKYLSDNGITGWKVTSAGTSAEDYPLDQKTLEVLQGFGIDATGHKRQQLTKEMLTTHDAVVAMAEDHIGFMKSQFGYKYAILFNELASNQKTSIENNGEDVEHIVRDIHSKIPAVFKNVSERFYLFSDFVAGRITHHGENGLPFITLHETPHSVAFMSVDIPSNEDGHILVIPKKRFFNLSEIPDEVLKDIFVSIKKVGAALNIDHGGYNVLLNNGLDAGQYMLHTHFHIIPRRDGDGIEVEGWKHPKVSREEFIRLNEMLKQQIQRSSSVAE
jgi:histidine triad (HIT) family protein